MTESGTPTPSEFSFGSFRLLRDQRLLLDGETPVRLGARAFEILATLVERPGVVVPKDELFSRVWPKQFVEEGNLKFHVATLRKALRDGQGATRYISNVPGRGYCFVAPVESLEAKVPAVVGTNPAPNSVDSPRCSDILWADPTSSYCSPRDCRSIVSLRSSDPAVLARRRLQWLSPTRWSQLSMMASDSSIWRHSPIHRSLRARSRRRSDSRFMPPMPPKAWFPFFETNTFSSCSTIANI